MELTLAELAARLGGRAIDGDATTRVSGVAALEAAGARDLGFVRSASFAAQLVESRVAAVIAPPGVATHGKPTLRSPAPSLDFARAAALLVPRARPAAGVHARAFVDSSASVDASAAIGPLASVGAGARIGARTIVHANVAIGDGAVIGADCELHAGASVGAGCQLGDRVILQPGCAIGGDGFGYEQGESGALEKVPQLGNVVLEDDVEVGANSTIDRARLGTTRVGRGSKIDNLVQIAHNVEIGAHSVVVAQSGIAGSTKTGERVFFMAQSGALGHLEIGAGSFIAARGVADSNLPPGSRIFGFPPLAGRAWHRANAWFARLPELARRLRALERRLGVSAGEEREK
ncbi:MAG: UDP-3-O-(3-hydroxymyristoyl)glucosamine N-acyltransferase [Deltaproteobacteria bacterium]|nr:UDP-3-O-(3-hydroxymyristoyl)glucosamine N-acyltransferase [Deltaproteobacteria bacterium]